MSMDLNDAFFQKLVTKILIEDWRGITRFLSLPLVVYSKEGVTALSTTRELEGWLFAYLNSLKAVGAKQVVSKIIEHKRVSATMSSYLVRQSYADRSGAKLGIDTLRYFVRGVGDVPAIEMIERI